MPRIEYKVTRVSAPVLQIIEQADQIATAYAEDGLPDVTMRQIYYRFIALDLFPDDWMDREYNQKHHLDPNTKNTKKNYGRFCSTVNVGRMNGIIDWDHLSDITRNIKKNSHWTHAGEILDTAAEQFRVNLWEGQKVYCEVWIEKDALQGVIKDICTAMDVPYFSCRGYSSLSEMWQAAQRIESKVRHPDWRKGDEERGQHEYCVILHLGDHDPSGKDMTRDVRDRLNTFINKDFGLGFVDSIIEVRRIALTMDQIRKYKAPPNPAKLVDPRSKQYVAEFGLDSWELDALEPKAMRALIKSNIEALLDVKKYNRQVDKQNAAREELRKFAKKFEKKGKR